ncbi:pyridoxal-phosphate-dependent aminotransferase family protein [Pelagovum pacificum]|uniref:Alanine--glyoxylate aminotransferase family protein n=1 Tax=Pelagovum pacificum TaxID=2588711 RepID=A0A5C5G8E6_9RHOB|nr:aminotransferase class V-fold PLP-dependent enzyme [Pelagovum pacificum]QQA41551.1 alanine--glyoxylate aminotransferase family protein [Pelagovum pacificum]TNY30831.1 alanine--glyoxylate aminotransferase family protein [Pelagovum pacificum]
MSLANGRHYLAIPGPSVMPDPVLAAMHRPAPNIYEGEIVDVVGSISEDLKWVAGTKHDVAIYISNGHGAWEAALANIASPGDRVLVAQTGRFAVGWAEMANAMGIETEMVDFGLTSSIEPDRIESALRADVDKTIKAVLVNHVDTATSLRNDIAAVRAAIDAADHPALLMVDCIASLACDRYEMDNWGADITVAGSQKGLMTPPGLGFVFFSDRAAEAQAGRSVSNYWNWSPRSRPNQFYQYFGGTAPTHHIYGLRQALDMLKDEGMEAVWHRHEVFANAYWAAIDAWSEGGEIRLNVPDQRNRSHAVTSVYLPGAEEMRQWCSQNLGVTFGIGLGREPSMDWFRIGHMGHINAHMVLGTIGVIEAGMIAMKKPHGEGAGGIAARIIAEGALA